jgi:hypothetical protein
MHWDFIRLYPGSRPEMIDYFIAQRLHRDESPHLGRPAYLRRQEGEHIFLEIALPQTAGSHPAQALAATMRSMRVSFQEVCGTHVSHYRPLVTLPESSRSGEGHTPLEILSVRSDYLQEAFADPLTSNLVRTCGARICGLVTTILSTELAGLGSRKTLVPVIWDLMIRVFTRLLGLESRTEFTTAHVQFCIAINETVRSLEEAIVLKHEELQERGIPVPFTTDHLTAAERSVRDEATLVLEEIRQQLEAHQFADEWTRFGACHHLAHVLFNGAGLTLADEFYLATLAGLALLDHQLEVTRK